MDYKTAVNEYMDYCKRQRKLSKHTVKSYSDVLRGFWKLMDEEYHVHKIEAVDREMVRGYLRFLNDNYAASSARHHFTVTGGFFGYLEDIEWIDESPFHKVHARIKAPKRLPKTLTLDDVNKILVAVYTSGSGYASSVLSSPQLPEMDITADSRQLPDVYYANSVRKYARGCEYSTRDQMLYYRDCTVLEFLFNTGLRIQELCNLKLEDFDVETGTLDVVGKGNRERKCFITQKAVFDVYNEYIKYRALLMKERGMNHHYIFINKFGQQMTTQTARLLINKYVKISGVQKKVTPHVFRHTFASLLLEEGVDLKHIQGFLGHSTIATTQIYLHISDDNAREILRQNHPRAALDAQDFIIHSSTTSDGK